MQEKFSSIMLYWLQTEPDTSARVYVEVGGNDDEPKEGSLAGGGTVRY